MAIELHDAEKRTSDWQQRHSVGSILTLGVWRWKGVRGEQEYILNRLATGTVVDFGGHDGPLGFGSVVVDTKAKIRCLRDLPEKVDTVFTSHTLEHCEDIGGTLASVYGMLNEDGILIAHVPAWTCKRWRAGEYDNPNQTTKHHWTFSLADDDVATDGQVHYVNLDFRIGIHIGPIIRAYHCGDDSLMIIARKT